jgi:hypothetical protein
MKYLCLAYYHEEQMGALSKTELQAVVSQCPAHDERLRSSGHLFVQASLGEARPSTVIRPRNGKPMVTDGPFMETKEHVGGFFIIEAGNLDEAVRIASLHPAAHLGEHAGWGIEVRPIGRLQQYSPQH